MIGNPGCDDDAFGVRTRRDRLFGLWAARRLGLEGGNALVYVAEVTDADAAGGERGMISKVLADLAREQVSLDHDTVARQLKACETQARQQLAG